MPCSRSDRRSAWPAVVAGGVLVPVLYVLSVGPTAWFVGQNQISMGTYRALYAPVEWCEDESPAIESAIKWYREVFVHRQVWTVKWIEWSCPDIYDRHHD